MLEDLTRSNRGWRVLWQVPVPDGRADTMPTIADLDEPTVSNSADVVMFAYRQPESSATDAELAIVKNRFCSTDTL